MKDVKKTKAYKRYHLQKDALLRGDLLTVKKLAKEAEQEMENMGYVRAAPAFKWILKEWLDIALHEGVLVRTATGYHPVALENIEKKVVGMRGRIPIEEKRITKGFTKFNDFCKRYEEYLRSRENM